MPQGMQVFRANGSVQLDTNERLSRIIGAVLMDSTEPSPFNTTGTITIPEAAQMEAADILWVIAIPFYTLDENDPVNSGYSAVIAEADPFNDNTKIAITQGGSATFPYMLVYGKR